MKNLKAYMPTDEVQLCNGSNQCIIARGDNAKAIVTALVILLVGMAAYYVSKIKW